MEGCQELGILPAHYPYPEREMHNNTLNPEIRLTGSSTEGHVTTTEEIVQDFPSNFNGEITTMEGELFSICLMEGAEPFCVKAPRSIPFAYREKLKKELDLLQQQSIIVPVTEVTEWCAPIVVTPKKGTDWIRLYVDLSRLTAMSIERGINHLQKVMQLSLHIAS